jgi:hypothetical protein
LLGKTFYHRRLKVLSRSQNFRPSIPLVEIKAQRHAIFEEIQAAIARV